MGAVKVHHTATTDDSWDGPAQVKNLGDDYTTKDLKNVFAWIPDGKDPKKGDCALPHHEVDGDGKPGAANVKGCQSAIGALNGAMGGVDIPDGDRKKTYDHLAAHLKDADVTPAELKATDPVPETAAVDVAGEELDAAAPQASEPPEPSPQPVSEPESADEPASQPANRTKPTGGTLLTRATTVAAGWAIHEQRFLEGNAHAARALALDALKWHALDLPFQGVEIRKKGDGTGGSRLLFTGYASVTEQPYPMMDWIGPFNEVVRSGAFKTTLSQDPDTAFLINHGGVTMARTKPGTLRLSEDDTGLYVEADVDPRRSDVADMASAVDGGELDEMSFAFWVVRQMWSPDYEQRDILEVCIDKGDVSVVNYGANPATGGLVGLRSRQLASLARSGFPGLVSRAYHQRTGAHLGTTDMAGLLNMLGLATVGADSNDDTRAVLGEVLGAQPRAAAPQSQQPESAPDPETLAAREQIRLHLTGLGDELRAGKKLSGETQKVLAHVLDLVAAADTAVDAAQPLLADLLGVKNPDADDDSDDDDSDSGDDPDGDTPDTGNDDGGNDGQDSGQGAAQYNALPLTAAQRRLQALQLVA